MNAMHITCDVYRDAACHILYYRTGAEYDETKITACRDALQFLIDNKDELRGSEKHIDAALHHIYPGLGKTNLDELGVLLEEELEIVKRILNKEKISDPEFDQLINFCQKMWIQLRFKEQGRSPYKGARIKRDS